MARERDQLAAPTGTRREWLAPGCVLLAGSGYGMAAWAAVWWCSLVLGGGPTATSQGGLTLLLAAALALALVTCVGRRLMPARGSMAAVLLLWLYSPFLTSATGLLPVMGFIFIFCFAVSVPSLYVLVTAIGRQGARPEVVGRRPAAFVAATGLGMMCALFLCVPWTGVVATMTIGVALAIVADVMLSAASKRHPGTDGPPAERGGVVWRLMAAPFPTALAFGCGLALTMRLMRCQVPVTAHSAGIATIWLLASAAIGWWIGSWVVRRWGCDKRWVAGGLLAYSFALACWVATTASMANFVREVIASAGESWPLTVVALFAATATYGGVSGALVGFVLAAECGRVSRDARAVRFLAMTVAAGVACGVAIAHLAVIGSVGLTNGFLLVGAAMLLLGGWRVCRLRDVRPKVRGLICAASVTFFLSFFGASSPSDFTTVSSATAWPSGKAISAKRVVPDPRERARKEPPAPKLLFHAVDEHGWLGVVQGDDGVRRLVADGIELSSTGKQDMMLSAMLAHVPASLCSAKNRALQLGARDAEVLAALVSHGFADIDCVEPRPGILEAAQWLGQAQNVIPSGAANVLARPPKSTRGRYDVIVSCPRSLWAWAASAAYSRDYFELCSRRLARGGVCATWLPLRHIEMSTLQDVLRTFSEVFQHTCLWLALDHVVLAGASDSLPLSIEAMAGRLSADSVRQRLSQDGHTTAIQLWSRLLMTTEGVKEFAVAGAVLRWQRPALELSAARSMSCHTFAQNLLLVSQYRNGLFQRLAPRAAPGELFDRLAKEFDRASVDLAHHAQLKTKEDDEFFERLLFAGKVGPRAVCPLAPGPAAYKANGIICFGMGFHLGAYRLLKKALYEGGNFKDAELRHYLGAACLRLKKFEEAERHLERALMNDPKLGQAHLETARLSLAKGKPETAIDQVLKGLEIDQELTGAHTLLGVIYGRHLRDYRNAALHFEIALVKDPNDSVAADNLRLLAPARWRKWTKGAGERRAQ